MLCHWVRGTCPIQTNLGHIEETLPSAVIGRKNRTILLAGAAECPPITEEGRQIRLSPLGLSCVVDRSSLRFGAFVRGLRVVCVLF